jgi:Meiotically Up-regulated Gene 113 (MUG113) protein
MAFTKELILQEIRRTARENGDRPLGSRSFRHETGIRYQDWFGRYWKSWGDAVSEAGLVPNKLNSRMTDDFGLTSYSALTRELGRVPVKGDLRLKKHSDPHFPNEKVFDRFRSKNTLLARARKFWIANHEWQDLLDLVPATAFHAPISPSDVRDSESVGFVYLLRSGKYYKIGRTNSVGRREYELAIQLPEAVAVLHQIETDDPEGIEEYWHKRFASKRAKGEWFKLDSADIAAFKKRKSQ